MTLYRNKYRVESARLHGWDYGANGYYFVTICVNGRLGLFGDIENNEMRLNEYGKIAQDEWHKSGLKRPEIGLDEFVIMPNHVHGIIRILNSVIAMGSRRDVARNVSTAYNISTLQKTPNVSTLNAPNPFSNISPRSGFLSIIIRSFKSAVSNRMHAAGFKQTVWQPRFYDHIIRNEESLLRIRQYIRNNPLNWDTDEENPVR